MKSKKFPSSIAKLNFGIISGIVVLLIYLLIQLSHEEQQTTQMIIVGIFMLVAIALLVWVLNATYYRIDKKRLTCRSGPLRIIVPVKSISRIEVGKSKWVGVRPALDLRGITIHYNKHKDVYISPADIEGFTASLLEYNPDIEVVDHRNPK